jgi:hypothetical protein
MGRVIPDKRMVNAVWTSLRRPLAAAAVGTFIVAGALSTMAGGAPTASAAPATDDGGFVDSTARCAPPNKAVAFGYTASSRVAICKDDASGQYQYRGVRVSDGARLILGATSTDRGYVAENDGITYTVTASALVITSGGQQVRDEPMIDFHGTAGSSAPATSSRTGAAPSQPSAAPETTAAATPLPPPLPAEVGAR